MRGICITLAAAFFAASTVPARAAGRPFRFDELARVERIGAFDVSADGKWIAYAVGTPIVLENRVKSAIWLAPAAGGAPRRLTAGEKRDSDPAFSPDGRRIAFLSNRDGSSQIWTVDLSGGEPSRATSFPTEVNGFKWSPDGKWFLFTSDIFPDCSDVACLDARAKERAKSPTKARISERLLFRHWDAWKEGLRTHVWKIPVAGGSPVDLTPGDRDAPPFSVGGSLDFDVSPDGKEFVYASNADRVEATSTNSDVWLVPFEGGGQPRNLTAANKAFDGSPRFSPDGKWIAYRAQNVPGCESDRFRLVAFDRATGATRELAKGFDDWVEDFEWAPDSRSIFFLSQVKGRGVILRAPIAGGAPSQVWKGGTAAALALSDDGSTVYFTASSLTRPAEIFVLPSRDAARGSAAAARTIVRANDPLLSETELGAVTERVTKSADGRDLQAWLVTPPGFDATRKYPAVVLIHGGPQSAWNDAWSYRWNPQVIASYGYVVYAPNPRGSVGFGQEFVDQVSRDWGGRVYDDLMRQTDDLESLPYVDASRIGAAGASFGGYMVAWILGHTDRFKALVCHDGVFDTRSMALETEELWFPTWDFGGWPWDSELYEKWNPVRFVENFKTPTLVITSEKDYRVPFGQGLQLFTALQVRGVPSKILTFPDEGHWVLKPGNSRVWHALVMDWLATHLGGARPDAESLGAVYSTTK